MVQLTQIYQLNYCQQNGYALLLEHFGDWPLRWEFEIWFNQILFRVNHSLSALVQLGTVGNQLYHGPETVVTVMYCTINAMVQGVRY